MLLVRCSYVERPLQRFFAWYGAFVGRHAIVFLTLPILTSLLIGILTIALKDFPPQLMRDTIEMYTPSTGRATNAKANLIKHFEINDTNPTFYYRRYDLLWMGWIIITSKNPDENILAANEVQEWSSILWGNVQDLTIYRPNVRATYNHICILTADVINKCVQNPLGLVLRELPRIAKFLKYPHFEIDLQAVPNFFIGNLFGGVTVDPNSSMLLSAKAVMLPYMLHFQREDALDLALAWERRLTKYLKDFQSNNIEISWWTYDTMQTETRREVAKIVLLMGPLFIIVTIFTFLCSLSRDMVRSKPWISLGGCLSAMMGIITSCNLILLCGGQLFSMVSFMPFIVFSIGVDDIYVLLAAWWRSNPSETVEKRMSATFRDAGVSITVTSVTNVVSFAVGCASSFKSIWMFCMFATVANIFVYIYQLTFFAALMVLSGRREAGSVNPFKCNKVRRGERQLIITNGQVGGDRMAVATITGEASPNPGIPFAERDRLLAIYFRDYYSSFLLMPINRFIPFVLYALYLTGAIYGICTSIKVGLNPIDVLPKDSYARPALRYQAEYFTDYNEYVHLWYEDLEKYPVTYSFLKKMEADIKRFEHTTYSATAEVDWIRNATRFFQIINGTIPSPLNCTDGETAASLTSTTTPAGTTLDPLETEDPADYVDEEFLDYEEAAANKQEFERYIPDTGYNASFDWCIYRGTIFPNTDVSGLIQERFFWFPAFNLFNNDARFTPDGRHLIASRVLIRLRHFGYENQSKAMHMFEALAKESPFNAQVFTHLFLFAQQNDQILPSLLINIAGATVAVMLVTLIFIPNPFVSFWVCLNLISINIGIIGYGSLWGVTLDFASMTTIVMSVGFCVDYTAHVAYHFSKDATLAPADRLRHALHAIGMPIVQSAASTILGISVLAVIENYVGYAFVKTIFLAVIFGAMHGLLMLPVILNIIFSSPCCKSMQTAAAAKTHRGNDNGRDHTSAEMVEVYKPKSAATDVATGGVVNNAEAVLPQNDPQLRSTV